MTEAEQADEAEHPTDPDDPEGWVDSGDRGDPDDPDDPEPDPFPEGACEICGRFGSVPVHARKYTGRLLLGETTFWKGRACRDCGTAQYRAGQAHSLARGWWGLVPLVVNPLRLLQNTVGLWRMRSAPDPIEPALEPPFDPGRPVLLRPGAWIGILFPVLVVGAIAVVATSSEESPLAKLAVGSCIELPEGNRIESVPTTSCRGAHDAEVTGVRDGAGASEGQGLCEAEAERYLGGPLTVLEVEATGLASVPAGDDVPSSVVCLIVPSGDARFVRPMRGTGEEPG